MKISNLYASMAPMHHLTRLVGLAPYSQDKHNTGLAVRRPTDVAYSCVVFAAVLTGTAFDIYFKFLNDEENVMPRKMAGNYVSLALRIMSAAVALLSVLVFKRAGMVDFFKAVQHIDSSRLEDSKIHQSVYSTLLKQAVVLVVVFTVKIACTSITFINVFGKIKSAHYFTYLHEVFEVATTYQYASCMLVVRSRLEILNLKVAQRRTAEDCRPLHPHPRAAVSTLNNPTSIFHSRLTKEDKILSLQKHHLQLTNLSKSIVTTYQHRVLSVAMSKFFRITYLIHLFLPFILDSSIRNPLYLQKLLTIIFNVSIDMGCLLYLVYSSHLVTTEANQTAAILQECLLKPVIGDGNFKRLQLFLQQVLASGGDPVACDVLRLHPETLVAMMSAAVTYLTILLQK